VNSVQPLVVEPREDYTYFDDGTVLVPTHGNREFSLHAPRSPIDHVWRLYASTMEDARSLYTVGAGIRTRPPLY
jgi:hypothetical protein